MRFQKPYSRTIGLVLVLLLCFTLLINTTAAQSESGYAVRFTHVLILCAADPYLGEEGQYGAYLQYGGTWQSPGEAVMTDHFTAPGIDIGGDLYFATSGSGKFTYNYDPTSWGAFFSADMQYPFTFQIKVRMIIDGLLDGSAPDQVRGGTVVAQTIATATCTGPGYTPVTIQNSPGADDDGGFQPDDGRLNVDAGAPVSIYCQGKDVQIYAINSDSEGELALMVTADQLGGDPPSENTLLAQADLIRLYRLTTGELQVNVGPDFEGKEYVFIWNGCES